MPGERDRADEEQPDRGDEPAAARASPSATPSTTTSSASTSSNSEHGRGLGREQPAARERRRAEPLQHAVAALEAGRDPERHHRRGHHRERQHAGHEEVDRVLEVGRDRRVDLGEEHEDPERDRERDDQVLAAAELQHELGSRLRDERLRLIGDRAGARSAALAVGPAPSLRR